MVPRNGNRLTQPAQIAWESGSWSAPTILRRPESGFHSGPDSPSPPGLGAGHPLLGGYNQATSGSSAAVLARAHTPKYDDPGSSRHRGPYLDRESESSRFSDLATQM